MHLQAITIMNWKVYESAHFEFPAPVRGQNLVLIGAPNGHGKTSFFEAVILGLFGKKGLPLVEHASYPNAANAGKQPQPNYMRFMEGVLHRGARGNGRATCSVEMVFADAGEKTELKRTWHFRAGGSFTGDEEIVIRKGSNRKPVGPENGVGGSDRENWFHEHIDREFLPHSLARFFLYDGEQVRFLAEQGMAPQVRMGIEGLLGLPILRDLKTSLRDYAARLKRLTRQAHDDAGDALELEIKGLEGTRDQNAKKLGEIEPQLASLRQEQDRLTREIGVHGGRTQFDFEEQSKLLAKHNVAKMQADDELQKMLEGEISLALVGSRLREALAGRLKSEGIRADWEAGQQHGETNLGRFTASLKEKIRDAFPELTNLRLEDVIDCVRGAWKDIHLTPANCAENYLHGYLSIAERANVIEKLTAPGAISAPAVVRVLDTISESETKIKSIQEMMSRAQSVRPEFEQKHKRLQALNVEIPEKSKDVGVLERENVGLDGQINAKHQAVARQASLRAQSEPANRKRAHALKIANIIDEISAKTMPMQIRAISDAMTGAFTQMAHKELVSKIEISDNFDVLLKTAGDNVIETHELSAGEKQIFTQALIAAVVEVSSHSFPMIIDTPLGRLDEQHRKEVLRHLALRDHQVILLSTNTEVVGEYLGAIDRHVQKKYRLRFAKNGDDVGKSEAAEGYFSSTERQPS